MVRPSSTIMNTSPKKTGATRANWMSGLPPVWRRNRLMRPGGRDQLRMSASLSGLLGGPQVARGVGAIALAAENWTRHCHPGEAKNREMVIKHILSNAFQQQALARMPQHARRRDVGNI